MQVPDELGSQGEVPPGELLGKSKWGLIKWGLKATLCNSRTIVHNCALLWPFWAPLQGEFSSQNDDNRRQSWTIVDKLSQAP